MKKTRMFYGNQYIGSVTVDGKKRTLGKRISNYIKFSLLTMAKGLIAIWILLGMFHVGKISNESKIVYAEKEVVKEVEVKTQEDIKILERIAKCESGGSHFDKNGQVLMRGNVNKTVDIGYFQINEYYWGKKATELGYNLTKEEDNKEFGRWLFLNYGSEPWVHSKACWNK